MSFRLFLFLPLCLIFCGCGSSYCDEVSLEEVSEEVTDQTDEMAAQEPEADTGEDGSIFVYVCGSVDSPGVYELPEGSRVFEALSLAGGTLEEAELSSINQAEACYDGEKIYVPAVGEAGVDGDTEEASDVSDGRININTADSSELQKLKGIGESRAEDIISYREKNGKFLEIEGIMEVPGIKQGTFDKIKDQIRV